MGVDAEVELLLSCLRQAGEEDIGSFKHLAACFTDEVSVGGTGQVIRGRSMSEVGVFHDT